MPSASNLSFSHINLRGITGFVHDTKLKRDKFLYSHMISNEIAVCSVVETHLKLKTKPENIPVQYDFFGEGRHNAWGGTGLFFLRSLGCVEITEDVCRDVNIEATFASFIYRSESFVVGSIYLPQSSDREILSFLTVCDRVSKLGSDHVLIGTDAKC